MDELSIARSMLLRLGRDRAAADPLARALLAWARPHARWLLGTAPKRLAWRGLLDAIGVPPPADRQPNHAIALAGALADALAFGAFDRALLIVAVAVDRAPRAAALAHVAATHVDLTALVAEVAGAPAHDAARAVRRSAVATLGLIGFPTARDGAQELTLGWPLERLLDRAPGLDEPLIDALVGERQIPKLAVADFPGQARAITFLVRLIAGAVASRAAGINVLLYGPPGTGKTELARTLAHAAGAPLHSVGEADSEGDEPNRWERLGALRLAQRLLAGQSAVVLFDELEDLIGDAQPSAGDWFTRRDGSKLFVNRLLETNPVPTIWTTNAIGNLDPAILRRMSYVLKLDVPTRSAAARMCGRIAREEGIGDDTELAALIDRAPETATVLRVAARAGCLAKGGAGEAAYAIVSALRGGVPLPCAVTDPLDLDLFETDEDLGMLIERVAAPGGAADVSMLLTGPPGTGKTALAQHLARALDRPLIVRRASDLLSKWVGETEKQIARAFDDALSEGAVLLFDEVDGILFDRATARQSWEVTQVNELLTWLDRHPLPFVAATNHAHRLDPAALRRFVFKIELRPLGRVKAARAFARFFDADAPSELADVTGLTPGDFAVVARQLRHAPAGSPGAIVARLQAEAQAKPNPVGRIGF